MQSNQPWRARFLTIWIGQALSLFGSQLAGFGLVWWMTQTTGSATVLALGSMMTMLPGVVLGPFVGALVDRWDRRVVMIVADLTAAVAAAVLAVLFWADAIQIWQIYLIMFIRSVAGAFHFPSMQASTSLLVPPEQLTRVAGMNQTLQGMSMIAAPPLGALLLTILPLPGMMAIDVVTALIAVSTMASVRVPRPERSGEQTTVMADVVEGLRYIWHWKGLRIVMFMAAILNLVLNPAFALMPILVTRHFGGQAIHLAGMEAAMGIGFILGGVLLGVWGGFRRKIFTVMLGLLGLAAGAATLGLAPSSLYAMGVAGMFVMGVMSPITNGPMFAIVQASVPPEMQGRVFMVLGSASGAMSPIGLALAGPLSDQMGAQSWYLIGAAMALVLLVVSLAQPAVLRIEEGSAVARRGAPAGAEA